MRLWSFLKIIFHYLEMMLKFKISNLQDVILKKILAWNILKKHRYCTVGQVFLSLFTPVIVNRQLKIRYCTFAIWKINTQTSEAYVLESETTSKFDDF